MARKRKSKKEDYSLDFLKEQQVSEDEDAGSRNEYGNVNDYRDNPDDDEDAYPQEVDEPEEPDFSLEDEDVSMDTYSAYLAEVLNHKILTREQEHELFEKFKNAATEEEKKKHQDEIVEHNMKLVFSVIKREFSRRATPRLGFQDLISEGTLGLMHAIKKFDPDKGTKFSTYASLWIRQYAQRAIASGGLAYRLPPPEYHRLMSILTAQNNFINNNILKPSVEQLSAATGLTTQKIETLLRASQINLSLDAQISGDTHTGETETQEFGNFIPDPKTDIEDEVLNNEKRVIRRTLKDETPEEHAERCRVAALQVYSKRIVDITRLVDIRGGKIVNCRHRLLFYLEGFLRCARMKYDKRKEVIVGINNKFKEPLPQKDLEDILHGRGLCYTPSNQKLIDDLFITNKEQSILTTIIGANEKQVRRMLKNKHKMSREEYTELMLKQIIFYMSKGYTQTEIAEKLCVTSRTVRNYINKFGITNIVIEQCNDSDNRFDDESRNQNASKIAKSHKEDFALEDHKTTSGANKKRNKELKKKKKEEQQALRKAQSKQAEEYIIRMVKKLFDAPRKEAEEILILITQIALQRFKISSLETGIKETVGKVLSPATSEQVLLLSSPRYSRPTCGKNDMKLGFPYILNAFPDETGLNFG